MNVCLKLFGKVPTYTECMRYSYYSIVVTVVYQKLDVVFFKMPSRRSRREKNRAKKIAKLNDDCCVGESQDIEERDSFQEAHEKKEDLRQEALQSRS